MKYILIPTCAFMLCFTLEKTNSKKNEKLPVPKELLCGNSMSWVLSKLSASGFVKTAPEPGLLTIVKAKFNPDARFMFSFQKGDTANAIQLYTIIEGNVEFGINQDGSNTLTTHATSGKEIVIEKGIEISKTIEPSTLTTTYSNTYLWERMSFAGIHNEDFLLLVNLDEHPTASTKTKGSINKAWVSKFYIR